MGSVTEPSTEFAWKLNSRCWNPLATTAVVPFVMLIRTILIPNLDCFDGERNALLDCNRTKGMSFIAMEPQSGCNPDCFDYKGTPCLLAVNKQFLIVHFTFLL